MASPVALDPGARVALSKAELDALLTAAVEKALGSEKMTAALQPLNEKQQTLMAELLDVQRRQEQRDKKPEEKGLMFARQARAMFLGQNDVERAIYEVKRQWGKEDPVLRGLEATKEFRDASSVVTKAGGLTAGAAAAAGNIVIPEWSREWIELLRNSTVVRSMKGIRVLPMPVGAMTIRKQGAAGTAYYVGEAANITKSAQSVNLVNLLYKKLAGLTVVSNDLLRFAGTEADAFVRDDLLAVCAIREDLAFLQGDGTSNTPVGILNWVAAGSKFASAGTTLANQQTDLAKIIRKVQEGNVPLMPGPDTNPVNGPAGNGYFIMSPRTYWGLWNLTATTGQFIFRDELSKFMLYGYNVKVTNQVPITASAAGVPDGTGAASFLYFVHAPCCLIGESLNVQLDVFYNGTYYDGSVVVSGISTDETVVRVLMEHDFALRHDVGASVVINETVA